MAAMTKEKGLDDSVEKYSTAYTVFVFVRYSIFSGYVQRVSWEAPSFQTVSVSEVCDKRIGLGYDSQFFWITHSKH